MSASNLQASPVSVGSYRTQNGTTDTGPRSLAAEHQVRAQYRAAAVEDMAHRAVRMKAADFRDKFFPLPKTVPPSDQPQWDVNMFKGLEKAQDMVEARISEEFIKALKSEANLTPDLTLAESPHCPDQGADASSLRVDAGFFRSAFVPTDRRPHWADQVVPVEFKSQDTRYDPYDDRPRKDISADAGTRKVVRGQLIDYAEVVFRYQHRTELYMLLILGRRFRFLRWDRSGTIVTPAVDYYENPAVLCEMLWRMSLLNDEQLGLDPSARRLLPKMQEYQDMDAAAVPRPSDVDHLDRILPDDEVIPKDFVFRYVRERFAASLDTEWPRYRLEVPHGTSVRVFLVGKPNFRACGMVGRRTRGYIALDCATRRFVWLKDAWRTFYNSVEKEGTVLEQLSKAGVPYVPTLVCHGDVLDQETKTPEVWEDEAKKPLEQAKPPLRPRRRPTAPLSASSSQTLSVPQLLAMKPRKRGISEVEVSAATLPNTKPREDCPLRRHKHYRIVVEEVCMPLSEFRRGRQLLEIVLDCVIAHREATRVAHIVHGDVSAGNILILPKLGDIETPKDPGAPRKRVINWTGVLVDWELSKPIHAKYVPPCARQPERAGTWRYMSVATLNEHGKVIETSDEMEAFLHVILYHAVRYMRSNCTTVSTFIKNFFDSYTYENGKYSCGDKKASTMYTGRITLNINANLLRFNSPLDLFFSRMLNVFKAHYAVMAYDTKQAKSAEEATPPPSPTPDPPSLTEDKPPRFDMAMISKSRLYTFPEDDAVEMRKAPELPAPAPEVRASALLAQDHDFVMCALLSAINMKQSSWPPGERVAGDNMPITYGLAREMSSAPMPASLFKKARKGGASSFAATPSEDT